MFKKRLSFFKIVKLFDKFQNNVLTDCFQDQTYFKSFQTFTQPEPGKLHKRNLLTTKSFLLFTHISPIKSLTQLNLIYFQRRV